MASNNETTTKFKVDISELKAGITEANRQIKLANAQFKSASAAMDDWSKSAEGLEAKINQTSTVLKAQKTVLNSYKQQLELIVAEYGENSAQADNMRIKIENQKAAVIKTQKSLGDYEKQLEEIHKSTDGLGNSLDKTTKGGLSAFTVALGNLAANAISSVIDKMRDMVAQTIEVGATFDKSMSNVAALSGASADEIDMLRETAKKFGSETQFSASEAADALGYMALAGWDANTSASALGGVLDLAAASNMDLAEASDMVTDYMSAFNIEAEKSSYFADVLAYAQAHANTTAEGLGEAFKNCAANLNAAGQDFETTTSLLSMMANQGLKGSEAGTALTAVMRDMTSKMKDGAIAIGNTSVQVMDANGNYRDLTDILADVEKATQGMGDAQKATALQSTFTSDSIKGLNLILNAGVSNAADFENELRNATGSASDMAQVMNDNLSGDMTELSSQLEGVQIALYEKFEPALRKGVDALGGLLDGFQWLIDHGSGVATVVTSVASAVGVFMLYIKRQAIMTAFTTGITAVKTAFTGLNATMMANPIGIVLAAIAALVTAFTMLWNTSDSFRSFWLGIWSQIQTIVSNVWTTYLQPIFQTIGDKLTELSTVILDIWNTYIWPTLTIIGQTIQDLWANILQPVFQAVGSVIDWLWNTVISVILSLWAAEFALVWNGIAALWENVLKPTFDILGTTFKWLWDNILSPVLGFIGDTFSSVFNGIKWAWDNVLKPVFDTLGSTFKWVWDNILSPTIDNIKSAFETMGNKISEVWDNMWTNGLKPVINSILGGMEKLANGVVKGMNKVIKALNNLSFDVPDWVPELGGKTFGFDIGEISEISIPRLAKGGVVTKSTLANIGEAGAEAIIPLKNNREWIAATASQLKQSLVAEGLIGGASEQIVNNNYNFNQTNTSPKALDSLEIFRNTKSLLFDAKTRGVLA